MRKLGHTAFETGAAPSEAGLFSENEFLSEKKFGEEILGEEILNEESCRKRDLNPHTLTDSGF